MNGFNMPANTMTVRRGSSKTYELTVTDEKDQPVDLTGARLIFSVKAALTDQTTLIQKTSSEPTQIEILDPPRLGKARIYLRPVDTGIDPYQYTFDLWVVLASGKRYPVIEPSTFEVKPSVSNIPF